MKKINIFNKTISPLSDGKGCPVERGGVWELPRRTPCATPSWKEGERKAPSYRRMPVSGGFNRGGGIPLFSGMTAVIFALFVATPSFADPTPAEVAAQNLAKKTVASQYYVDQELETKQDKIPAATEDYQSVLIDTDNDGVVGKMQIITADYTFSNNLLLEDLSGTIPTSDAVFSELDNYWQPKITTGSVNYYSVADNETKQVPSLVSYDSTNGLKGNQIGILDFENTDNDGWDTLTSAEMDNFVPTVRAVAEALQNIWDNMFWVPLTWNNTQSTAINAYNTTFGTGTNNWVGNGHHLINGQFLANSLALKQNKIPAGTTPQGLDTAGSVLTYTNSAGTVGEKYIIDRQKWDDLTSGRATWTDDYDYMLVNAGDIDFALNRKQNKLPAKSTGNGVPKGNQVVVLNTDGNPSNVYTTAGKDLALTAKYGAQEVMNYIDGTTASATFATSQGLTEAQVKATLVSLELLKDVYSELNSKITNNALPTGTTGTVVTYNGVNAETGVQEFGERAVYDPANTYNAQNDATKLATMASVKYECAGYEAGHENDPDYCWLWALPN